MRELSVGECSAKACCAHPLRPPASRPRYPPPAAGLRIKEAKEVYEGEVTELSPVETENPGGGYGKVSRAQLSRFNAAGWLSACGTACLSVAGCP